jgi:integrase
MFRICSELRKRTALNTCGPLPAALAVGVRGSSPSAPPLRHTHATLLLADGVPVKVVSERLGHASPTITLTVYQHVHPGMGREAADRFAALLGG